MPGYLCVWRRLYAYLGLHWGDVARLLGLAFSVLATIFSKRAARAAREARDLALSRSLAKEFERRWPCRAGALTNLT